MRITLRADVYTAGKSKMEDMKALFGRTEVYAYNKPALMVAKGNPMHIQGLRDLERVVSTSGSFTRRLVLPSIMDQSQSYKR